MKLWFLRLYAPLFLFGFLAAAIAWVGHRHGDPLWLLALLALAIAVSFMTERLWPYDPSFNHDHYDRVRDTLHALVNEGLNLLSIAAVPLLAAIIPWQAWPQQWPFALQVLVAIIAADLGITLVHYASHRIGWLWRLHAVHHSVTRMYGFNGLMKHCTRRPRRWAGCCRCWRWACRCRWPRCWPLPLPSSCCCSIPTWTCARAYSAG
jgi:sterol desaturase/sphingolipid hydroxylase (fatty acid hydroxylase superfamily)